MGMRKQTRQQRLKLVCVLRRETKVPGYGDRRRRVNYVLAEYRGEDDNETYRKAFRSYGTPTVPAIGTHSELNNLAEQYGDAETVPADWSCPGCGHRDCSGCAPHPSQQLSCFV